MADLHMAWGKCTVTIDKTDSAEGTTVVPVEGTTTLNVTEGDKTEAKEEGGGVVAVKYSKNTYELQFATREKIESLTEDDGVITGDHTFIVTPEESGAITLSCSKCHMTCVPSFSSTDGWQFTYKCAALRTNDTSSLSYGTKA